MAKPQPLFRRWSVFRVGVAGPESSIMPSSLHHTHLIPTCSMKPYIINSRDTLFFLTDQGSMDHPGAEAQPHNDRSRPLPNRRSADGTLFLQRSGFGTFFAAGRGRLRTEAARDTAKNVPKPGGITVDVRGVRQRSRVCRGRRDFRRPSWLTRFGHRFRCVRVGRG